MNVSLEHDKTFYHGAVPPSGGYGVSVRSGTCSFHTTAHSIQLKHFQHFSKPLTDGSTLYLTRVLVYTIIHGG